MRRNVGSGGSVPGIITEKNLVEGLRYLSARDDDLADIWRELGTPPMWARAPGFPTLVHIILEQQVSLASAKAAFERLLEVAAPLTPRSFLSIDDGTLKRVGFSRQKIVYGRHLAASIREGRLDLESLVGRTDEEARAELLKVKGIGVWTSDIYLLMALRRPDIWPSGDLAIAVAVQRIKRLRERPQPEILDALSEGWKPWRSVAARLLWHYYLSKPAPRQTV